MRRGGVRRGVMRTATRHPPSVVARTVFRDTMTLILSIINSRLDRRFRSCVNAITRPTRSVDRILEPRVATNQRIDEPADHLYRE